MNRHPTTRNLQGNAEEPALTAKDAKEKKARLIYITDVIRQPLLSINVPLERRGNMSTGEREEKQASLSALNDAIMIMGVTDTQQPIGIRVTGFNRYFFLQFHDVARIKTDEQINRYLTSLQTLCRVTTAFTVPLAGNMQKTKTVYNKIATRGDARDIVRWTRVPEHFKTCYGWSPGPLQGLLQLWVHHPTVCDTYATCIESTQYAQETLPLVRMFEGPSLPDDCQFRLDCGIKTASWCYIVPPFEELSEPIFYTNAQVTIDISQIYKVDAGVLATLMPPQLRIVSLDIECAVQSHPDPYSRDGKMDARFPVADWSAKLIENRLDFQKNQFEAALEVDTFFAATPNYVPAVPDDKRNLKIADAVIEIKRTLAAFMCQHKPWDPYTAWHTTMVQRFAHLAPYLVIPDPQDTDPVVMVVLVLQYSTMPAKAPYQKVIALVLKHPLQKNPIDRQSSSLVDYNAIELRMFDREVDLLRATEETIHAMMPHYITGWNVDNFDLPYLTRRWAWHRAYAKLSEFRTLNLGMLRYISGKLVDPSQFQYQRVDAAAHYIEVEEEAEEAMQSRNIPMAAKKSTRLSRSSRAHVTTPLVIHIDGIVIWQNASFGCKSASYSLDNVAAHELVYDDLKLPNGNRVPRRKLQVAHSKTIDMWREGGGMLWFFICYCYVDTILPLLLLEKRAKLSLLLQLSNMCNSSQEVIYNNGMQLIITPLLHGMARELYNGIYLIPEWGSNLLHIPDVWLNADPRTKARSHPYAIEKPKSAKGYIGGYVQDPDRGLHLDPVVTLDFSSLYPSNMESYHLDYTTLLTKDMIKAYKIPAHHFHEQCLGPASEIFYGEFKNDPDMAALDGYASSAVKTAHWHVQADRFVCSIILRFMSRRSQFKAELTKWTYALHILNTYKERISSPLPTIWDTATIAPLELKVKLGSTYYNKLVAIAMTQELWDKEVENIRIQALGADLPLKLISVDTNIKNADSGQLACKLLMNSVYGYTGAAIEGAKLPAMEIAASTTTLGRKVIKMSAAVIEQFDIDYLKIQRQAATDPSIQGRLAIMANAQTLETALLDSKVLTWQDSVFSSVNTQSPDFTSLEAALRDNYNVHRRPKQLNVHYGDTDSIMVSHNRQFNENGLDLTINIAETAATIINSMLPGIMNIVHEKTSLRTLFIDRKNYIMWLKTQDALLYKGIEIARGDTVRFLTRILLYAAEHTIHKSEYNLAAVVQWIKDELMKFAQGHIESYELVVCKKLAKLHYSNATKPEHARVAEKLRTRGKKVEVGDFISYVYIKPSTTAIAEQKRLLRFERAKGRLPELPLAKNVGDDTVEDSEFAFTRQLPIDYEHYWNSTIKKAICKFFRHILAPREYPYIDESLESEAIARVKTARAGIKVEQYAIVEKILCSEVDQYFAKAREHLTHSVTQTQTLFHLLSKTREVKCTFCSLFFHTALRGVPPKVCQECRAHQLTLAADLHTTIARVTQEQEAAHQTCVICVAATGFCNIIDIESCTKFDCPVYEEKTRLSAAKLQAQQQIDILLDPQEAVPLQRQADVALEPPLKRQRIQ